jgi:hypothetical protein
MVLPNGMDLRIQKIYFLEYAALLYVGGWCLLEVDFTAGIMMLYLVFACLHAASFSALTVILMLSIFFCFLRTHDWDRWRDKLYDALIVIAVVSLSFQVMQYLHFGYTRFFHAMPGWDKALIGVMANPDDAFALYMICAPAFCRRRRWFLAPVWMMGLIFASPVFSSMTHYDVAVHVGERLAVWKAVMADVWRSEKWIGRGFAPFTFFSMGGKEMFTEAHNEFVEWFWRGGIIGTIIFLAFLSQTMRSAWRDQDKIPFLGLLCSCVAAIGFFPWHLCPLLTLSVFYAGLVQRK